ncbi:MAG: sodium:proton antiporter [Planctomycetes bacterium]|jgi:Na+/H+ antiporter NhaC|nr:sodium:proton antiporter [Planctomycetota bacterium]
MKRVLPAGIVLLLVIGAILLPQAGAARLSALGSFELLAEEVEVSPGVVEPLWQLVLESEAAQALPGGGRKLLLQGVSHGSAEGLGGDLLDHGVCRRSIVRGLRQYAADGDGFTPLEIVGDEWPVADGGANFQVTVGDGSQMLSFYVDKPGSEPVIVARDWHPPGKTSLLPPLVAVAFAILFRKPLLALFLGIFSGALFVRLDEGSTIVGSVAGGFVNVFDTYFWSEFIAEERAFIIGFVVFMLAMVGVMTRAGGIHGLMEAVARLASTVRRTQVATWLMGLVVFFDDYANTILVGSTMRPLTDRFKISREKLSYIVDSTAAPVAGLSIFSTWIAFEVSTFNHQLPAAGLPTSDGYAVFLRTVPYSFYCFLTLYMVGLIALTGRDLGPMLSAEKRARTTGLLIAEGATPMVSEKATDMTCAEGVTPRAWRAILPLATFLVVTLLEILRNGGAFALTMPELFTIEGFTGVLYNGSGSRPLFVGSLAGLIVAALGGIQAGIGREVPLAAWKTLRSMSVAFAILYMAWMIGAVCSDLGTASFLTALVGDKLSAPLLPTLLFLVAGGVAFATGSSWSTMSILLPLVVGLAFSMGATAELAETAQASGELLMVMSIGAVLSGAIFGDHCSPISDTTVMSSISSAADHIDHVRTQAPYALLAMGGSIVCGYFPATYFGLSPWLGLVAGALLLTLVVFVFGKKTDPAT